MRRSALVALLLGGCNLFTEPRPPPGSCTRDQDCSGGERCYVDGCGKLPDDMLAEVTTSVSSGVSTVDLPVGPAVANLALVLPDVQLLALSIRRGGGVYPAPVQLLASGQSTLIPGVTRVAQTEGAEGSGVLRVPFSTGLYTLVVSPLDPGIPPAVHGALAIDAGVTPLTVTLVEAGRLQTLAGVVLAGPGQPEPAPPDVQLLGADGRPLSARRSTDASGAFQLSVETGVLAGGAVLQVSPATGVLGAVASFPVADAARFAQPFIVGDGVPPVRVSGTFLGPDGAPVANATVYIQGTVVGSGWGNTGPGRTAEDGSFSLDTLPQAGPGTLALWVIPPAGSTAGLLRTTLLAPPGSPVTGTWTCPSRPLLRGTVLLPDAGPFARARLQADPVSAGGPAGPLPPTGAAGVASETGTFAIRLDPGTYQLAVQAAQGLPAVRNLVAVPAAGAQLEPIQVTEGRELTARVLRKSGAHVSHALVSVYRPVTVDGGTPRALLLGQGVSDESGTVRILLPQQP
ncbi:MAG TPA: hypothetical protein VLQ79_05650 [Myxococcaceae bacterium]|nr:hypothetical protein [Myxococcaceae bacterium]